MKLGDLILLSLQELPLNQKDNLKATFKTMGDFMKLLRQKEAILACVSKPLNEGSQSDRVGLRTCNPTTKDIFKN